MFSNGAEKPMPRKRTAAKTTARKRKTTEQPAKRTVSPYDAAAKQLLGCTPILAFILKHTVEELKDCSVEQIAYELIEERSGPSIPVDPWSVRSPLAFSLRNEDNSLDEGTVFYDMLVRVRDPRGDGTVGIVVNIEPQAYETEYPILKRAVYYCARLLSAQRGWGMAGSDYDRLEKVYSIWIFTGPPSTTEGAITAYGIQEQTVQDSPTHNPSEYDLLNVLLVHPPRAGGYNGFLEKLATLFSLETGREQKLKALEADLTWGLSAEVEETVGRLVSMGEYAVEYGMEKGEKKASLRNIQALMETMALSAEQAMDALKIPEESRTAYRESLEGTTAGAGSQESVPATDKVADTAS